MYLGQVTGPGARGTQVAYLQRLLVENGQTVDIDGVFGSQTQAAVKAFQVARGLTADGIVGPKTLQALVTGAQAMSMQTPVTMKTPAPASPAPGAIQSRWWSSWWPWLAGGAILIVAMTPRRRRRARA